MQEKLKSERTIKEQMSDKEKSMNCIYPKALKPGDNIGVVAPSSHFKEPEFMAGVKLLEDRGFNVICHTMLRSKKRYLAGEDSHRAGMINDFFMDPDIDAILCARGGYGALRALSDIDFKIIRENPKMFLGFSDVSALLLSIYQRTGLITYHGPTITSLGKISEDTLENMFQCMENPYVVNLTAGIALKEGSSRGELLGGNLCTINHMLKTPFEPDFKDKILLLEDVGESPYKIDRMLSQMKLAGCFEGIRGLILGTFEGCGEYNEICDIAIEVFEDYEIPILADVPVGHGKDNMTVPMGVDFKIDSRGLSIRVC